MSTNLERGKERADLGKYRALGGWVEKPDDMQHALEGNVSADVVIAGAGFAGLSAALELTRLGANVVVIERDFAGFGASGRNAGYLAGAMALEYDLMFRGLSKERATQIVRYYDDAVGFVEDKLKEHDIDCEYVQSGWIGRVSIRRRKRRSAPICWSVPNTATSRNFSITRKCAHAGFHRRFCLVNTRRPEERSTRANTSWGCGVPRCGLA